MSAVNPFNASLSEIGTLTPRRKEYVRLRNVAQEERINDIADAILQYQKVIKTVRERYNSAGAEEQSIISPYLINLYLEIGQLFEEQGKVEDALRYYEHVARKGHPIAIECAKRLGSKLTFSVPEGGVPRELSTLGSAPHNKLAFCNALHRVVVLISHEENKGSGVLAKDDELGYVLITVEHVVRPGATVKIDGDEIFLDRLKCYESGSDILLFVIEDIIKDQDSAIPKTLVNAKLQIGEKVYFGGYPFNEMGARLHTGHISSIGKKGEISIDGVAVPGMSGGPIAVERNGNLVIIGAVASETFDPIEGFTRALGRMYADQSDAQVRDEFNRKLKQESYKDTLKNPQSTKITRGNFYIGWLVGHRDSDPDFFINIWDDLNKKGVISGDGGIDPTKIIAGQLGLREKYQQFEEAIIKRLKASTTDLVEMDPDDIQLPFETEMPTDSINTVSLSLVQSLSTGLITGHLLQEYPCEDLSTQSQESREFEIGRRNRAEKNKKKLEKKAQQMRAETKQSDNFVNIGVPSILYRYVSKEDAKRISKEGIVHSGEELDQIPFLTKASKKMAQSVGALSTDKLVAVYPDRIPGLARENIGRVAERNGVITYRINVSIPKDALEVKEA